MTRYVPASGQVIRAAVQKPRAAGDAARLAAFAPASPAEEARIEAGAAELRRLGFSVESPQPRRSEGYFAGSTEQRRAELVRLLSDDRINGVVGVRGGYGSNYLLDAQLATELGEAKIVLGFSDLTSLQIFLWHRLGWVTFYGPMLASGLDAGADKPGGYDAPSLRAALTKADSGWTIGLQGQALVEGQTEGHVLGGAMTMVEATFGTPWELDLRGGILLLEDRAMRPYQVDRVLMHFLQAGKLEDIRGIVLGEFPDCEPPVSGSPSVRDVCARILGPLGVPIVYGAALGHSQRAMLTIPLGVQARLVAEGEGVLEILEPAVVA